MSSCSDSGLSSLAASPKGSQMRARRRSKRRLCSSTSAATFHDVYSLTGQVLGEGAYGRVETCVNLFTEKRFAVKMISKQRANFSRSKVLKEIELCHLCQGQPHLMSMIEYFEEAEHFYLVFEKAEGGHLLQHIHKRMQDVREAAHASEANFPKPFTEEEARLIIKDLCQALSFLHSKGVAHRDLKPENVLCFNKDTIFPVKLGDFDLCSAVQTELSTPLLQSPVGSAEYMAPEVVRVFDIDHLDDDLWATEMDELALRYDKKCDMWSLGVLAYVLLAGQLPFTAHGCGRDDCRWDEGDECALCQHQLFDAICNEHLYFPKQVWQDVSNEAREFVSSLLKRLPQLRPSADEALRHPWLAQDDSKDGNLKEGLNGEDLRDEGLQDMDKQDDSTVPLINVDTVTTSIDKNGGVDAEAVTRVLHQLQLNEDQRRCQTWQELYQVEDKMLSSKEELKKSNTTDLSNFVSCGFDKNSNMAITIKSTRQQLCLP